VIAEMKSGELCQEPPPVRIAETNPNHRADTRAAQCGKAAAIAAYNYGILPLESCQRLFNRNPAWRGS
jgi:hypothetical protein